MHGCANLAEVHVYYYSRVIADHARGVAACAKSVDLLERLPIVVVLSLAMSTLLHVIILLAATVCLTSAQ